MIEQTGKLVAAVHRSAAEIRATAYRIVRESSCERAIRYARSIHQQNGSADDLPEPVLDFSALEQALVQLTLNTEPATTAPEEPPATGPAAMAA
ncbi:hypothetical protein [Amycolatopsis sp. DG1A-15b]|uniref:hypothetical protein n=1 Tax=Amycolatopsis sp. DG1A-15b TaxID=3052846 RepID=UPI00255BBC79|nr:hypothetical protein [Amycolatopsis sp. DG1A-15b]WIX85831.1 hypothetical protein QRY02_32095 [Amycolatopsis sp. DG1A-15b]